jgi:hypothetical protein
VQLTVNQLVVGSIPATGAKDLIKEEKMTCRGYDSKAVKMSKSVKRVASTIPDAHVRGAFIRSYVRILEDQTRSFKKEK